MIEEKHKRNDEAEKPAKTIRRRQGSSDHCFKNNKPDDEREKTILKSNAPNPRLGQQPLFE
jgi:hypothetical protein